MQNSGKSMESDAAIKWMVTFARPNSFWLLINVVSILILSGVNILNVHFIKELIGNALGEQSNLGNVVMILGIAAVLGFSMNYLSTYVSGRFGSFIERDVKQRIAEHMVDLPVAVTEQSRTGDLVSMMSNEVPMIVDFVRGRFPHILMQSLMFVVASVYMSLVNWRLFLASVAIVPVTMYLLNKMNSKVSKYSKQYFQKMSEGNSVVHDTLSGIGMVKAFQLEGVFYDKCQSAFREALHTGLELDKVRSKTLPVIFTQFKLPYIFCLIFGGYMILLNEIKPEELVAFMQLLGYIIYPAVMVPAFLTEIRNCVGAIERLEEVMNQPGERKGGEVFLDKERSVVLEFVHVDFSYGEIAPVLRDLSFQVMKGQFISLVGASGGGKSTILKMICGFHEATQGAVKLYGEDVKDWSLAALRQEIALVSQDVYLFPGTIAENIMYGRWGVTMEEVVAAAKIAQADEFIMGLSDGYATMVGERGVRLSGGQRQRIAIARAILKDAPIILLDEPTAALDADSEAGVQKAMEVVMENRTVIVVAHRLSTIRKADQILVLENGRIVEAGNHAELLERDGVYRQLYRQQSVA